MATVYTVGIDFGTANSCVAYASYFDRGSGQVDPDPLHRPEVIPFHNKDTVPTAIHLGDGLNQPPTFGRRAEERGMVDPQKLYTGFKLMLGRPDTGKDAYLMARYFLAYLRRRVSEFVPIGTTSPGERVETIVGHPVQWSSDQREATLKAAQEAGFPNVRLEEESLAALYCHVFDERSGLNLKPGSYVLTIDMGGGTTDFAFLQIPTEGEQRPTSIPVHPAPAEGRSYGGRDLDRILLQYLSRDWDRDLVRANERYLVREVSWFKEAFSSNLAEGATSFDNKILVGDRVHQVSLSRAEFEEVAAGYIRFFEVLVRGALEDGGMRADQVSHIILTGGHSRWYFVETTLKSVFPHLFSGGPRAIFRHSHPEQSVARGLAYDPLVRSNKGGFLAPHRRATHALWLEIPGGQTTPGAAAAGTAHAPAGEEPILLIPRGQLLPFSTTAPLQFQVEQAGEDASQTTVKVRLLSGHNRLALGDRMATFHRGFWEQVTKSITAYLRLGGAQKDHFEVEVDLEVSEHELITALMTVRRFLGGKVVDVQTRTMNLALGEQPVAAGV
jgi:molecular chaperone DnaK (HSP70)